MAGKASSTRTGSALSLALIPQTTTPVYASLASMVWMVVFSHFLPLVVGMPSALRVLTTSRMLLRSELGTPPDWLLENLLSTVSFLRDSMTCNSTRLSQFKSKSSLAKADWGRFRSE